MCVCVCVGVCVNEIEAMCVSKRKEEKRNGRYYMKLLESERKSNFTRSPSASLSEGLICTHDKQT